MNKTSWRHHYIPQFYLRGFTNPEGRFKIYDVQNKRFIKNGKFFSTESYFFEEDGNTLIANDVKDDFIETKFYRESDQLVVTLFNKINSAPKGTNYGLSDGDMPLLQFFIASMFWRLPSNFEMIKLLLRRKDFKELGINFLDNDGNVIKENEVIEKLMEDNNFAKAMRFLIPFSTFPKLFACKSQLRVQSFPDEFPSLCCDNPLVFENSVNPNVYTDDFIFPLTSNKMFFRSKRFNEITGTLKVEIDQLLLNQAVKYVCCTDERYIQELNRLNSKHYLNFEILKRLVFKQLFY